MRGGVRTAFATACLAAAGCTAQSSGIEIRPIADPAAKLRPGADRTADARGQLAIGNVGLAVEGFRTALREDPRNIDAYVGLAACYEKMGRFDLAGRYYQEALAFAPRDARILAAYAGTLEQQGDRAGAAQVREEISELASASAALDQASAATDEPAEVAAVGQSVTVALPPPRPVNAAVTVPGARPVNALKGSGPIALNDVVIVEPVAAPAPVNIPSPRLRDQAMVNLQSGPRLQRMSTGEVMLVTLPAWTPQVVARTAQSTTVHWVPITSAPVRINVRLLNAARRQGLAAKTRSYLADLGWRRIEIGDAPATRERSLVLYPAGRQASGRRLAAQFGFPFAQSTGDQLVVLLGRDAALLRGVLARA